MADAPTEGVEEDLNVQDMNLSTFEAGGQGARNIFAGCEVHLNQTTYKVIQQEATKNLEKTKMPIDNVRQPNRHFIPTTVYEKIKENVREVSILHLCGMPGTGKSEIICELAAKFPKDDNGLVAKWHIECSDRSHNIKVQLEKFANTLFKNGLVDNCGLETAIENMKSARSRDYLSFTKKAQIPVLIIIEDPQDDDKEFLEDFVKCVSQIDFDKTFHLYITSKSKSVINCSGLNRFNQENIRGFEMQEGLQMLKVSDDISVEEKQAAKAIITKLSSSPLGLRVVAATAKKYSLTFKKYLTVLCDDKTSRHLLRQESVEAERLNQPHLYNAIIKLLGPERMDEDNIRNWKAISALSLCHHGAIPTVLVGRIMQNIRSGEHDLDEIDYLNQTETAHFLKTFDDFGLCKVECDSSSKGTATFHQAVFFAVRWHLKENNQLNLSYPVAVQALASIVHKDLRSSDHLMFMKGIVPHMQALLDKYTFNRENKTFNRENKLKTDDLLLCFCTSHLYEVIGTVMSDRVESNGEKSVAETNLEESIHILSHITANLGFQLDSADLLTVRQLSDVSEFAKKIVDTCISCGNTLFHKEGFKLEEYLSIVLQFAESDFLSKFADTEIMDFINRAFELDLMVPPEKLAEFQQKNNKMFLKKEDLCKTYLVERFASVFHTISRLILYNHDGMSVENRHKSVWFSTLAFQLCENSCEKTGVSFLLGQLTQKSLVDICLKSLKVDPQKKETLTDAKSIVLANMPTEGQSETKYYEHGLIRQMKGNVYAELHNYRSIVRINCKFLSIGAFQDIEESTAVCEKLQKLSQENVERWPISLKCLVHCSKFWRRQRQYQKATDTILVALQHRNMQDVSEASWTYPWTCKNYARTVICGKLLDHKDLAVEKCTDALKEEHQISKSLVKGIKKCLEEISEL